MNLSEKGFEGILLEGNGSKEKVVIVMSGSNGGMKLTLQCATFYHEQGIPALALALFATKGTVPNLSKVPVEYVERAIHWLQSLGYKKIGIDGMSKGSEMALVAASMFSDLSCVIVRVPSYFVSEGLIRKRPSNTSCWSYQQKELPYAPYKSRSFNLLKMILKKKELYILPFNQDKDVTEESIIKMENIQAPILILSSKQDSVWPSYQSGLYIENRLLENQYKYPVKHVAYENMSHALVTKLPWLYKLAFRTERENAELCQNEREQLKQELLEWIKKW